MKKTFLFILLGLMCITYGNNSYSQKSYGGLPVSYINKELHDEIDHIILSQPDMRQIMIEDSESERMGRAHSIGRIIPVSLNMNNSGTWDALPDGTKIWRLKITAPEALSLTLLYSEFYLPEGSKLYLYNENRRHLIGALNHRNNPVESPRFSTQMIQGETTYLEYIEPKNITQDAIINIEGVAYNYRDVEQFVGYYDVKKTPVFGTSKECEININCPEGNNWQTEKRGVAAMYMLAGGKVFVCSGSLINNTANNGIPYFLSAYHCKGDSDQMDQWQFYFNFEASGCDNPTTLPTYQTVIGAERKAYADDSNGTDFLLLRLFTTKEELSSFNAYYNGWARSMTYSGSGIGIHHPQGDIKKISTYLDPLRVLDYANVPVGYWVVSWGQTTSGSGATESGSSGSPLFDGANKLIIGTLTAGSSECDNNDPDLIDVYGRMNFHWDYNGTNNEKQLKPWLDPNNTGKEQCQGFDPKSVDSSPVADFFATPIEINIGEVVTFTDMSTNNPTSWNWHFPGGSPLSSSAQNPQVIYNNAGYFDVSLTVTNSAGNNKKTINNYIRVIDPANIVADFSISSTNILSTECVSFTDASVGEPTGWNWSFPGADITNSTEQNPENICYSLPGTYDIILEVSKGDVKDKYICEGCIVVDRHSNAPVVDFSANDEIVFVGNSINFTDLSTNGPIVQWEWEFEGAEPSTSNSQNPQNITYSVVGEYDVKLVCTKANGMKDVKIITDYIKVLDPAIAYPTAEFAANYTKIRPGEFVTFLDFSTGSPYKWSWTFEGAVPATSNERKPSGIRYNSEGKYKVSLTVSNSKGTDTQTKEDYIVVSNNDDCTEAPIADFLGKNRIIGENGEVFFRNLSTGNPADFTWTFEGGTPANSYESSPSEPIMYETAGIYKVTLMVSNACGSNELTKEKYVYVFSSDVHSYCDTLKSVLPEERVEAMEHPTHGGYIAGHNGRNIRSFANFYDRYTFNQVEALIVPVYKAESQTKNTSYVDFCIWSVENGKPSENYIARKRVYYKDLVENQNNLIKFDKPVDIDGQFFAGFRINYNDVNEDEINDDLFVTGIVSNRGNDPLKNTFYSYRSGVWHSANDMYGFSTSLAIRPISCLVDVPQLIISESDIEVFPNPTTGTVNIKISDSSIKNFDIEIFDILGRKYISKYNISSLNEYSLDISNCPEGMYVLKINSGDTIINKKLLLTK